MSRLTSIISQVKQINHVLGAELENEFRYFQSRRPFGLNFERHLPESVELYGRSVRKGDKVRILPARGSSDKGDLRLWHIVRIRQTEGGRFADLRGITEEVVQEEVDVDDLVVVAESEDHIYPGLESTGKVERGGDKPFHTVINAENLHALETLMFTHRGKVDCIYIDPPYNTGAKDWKYNNDYVESDDLYRHSKWLAFMERRLLLARQLLNPNESILIITVDEKEYLRLGLLLEQTFPDGQIQMISTVINRKGNPRRGEFSRCEEFIFFIRFGDAGISAGSSDMLSEVGEVSAEKLRWKSLLRLASTGQTSGRFNLFYPLFFKEDTLEFLRAGEPLDEGVDIRTVAVPDGESVLWPISKDGSDGRWSLSLQKFNDYHKLGYIRFGGKNGGGRTPYYLMSGQIEEIASESLIITGRDQDGAVELRRVTSRKQPKTVWNQRSHSTSGHGTTMLRELIPNRRFPYPKSLYAVEDALRFAVGDLPQACVLDFFAGSGTTAHAVMRLNAEDGGHRQCIIVTNNEVASDEQRELRKQRLRPGDSEWEALGICEYITKPRIEASITGKTSDNAAIKGNYRFNLEFPIENGLNENAEFFILKFESPISIRHNRSFSSIGPLLWMRAGSQGRRIEVLPEAGWDVADTYGLLVDLDKASAFCSTVNANDGVRIAYLVTDDERRFQSVARQLRSGVETVRLYESYMDNFRFIHR